MLDTVIDPLVGLYTDRAPWVAGEGRYRPFVRRYALPFGVVSALAFLTPEVSPGLRLVYAWVTYLAFGIIYSLINVPYSALMSVISADPVERSKTSFLRMVGAQAAGLIISSGLLYLVGLVGGGESLAAKRRGFFFVMSFFAVLAVLMFRLCARETKERVVPEEKGSSSVRADLQAVAKAWPWWLLFFISFFTIAAFTLRFGVAAYYFKYYADPAAVARFAHTDGGAVSAFFTVNTVCSLLGVASFSFLVNRWDKKVLYGVLCAAAGLLSLRFHFIEPTNVLGIILTQAAFGFVTAPLGAILFSMYTDIAVYMKAKSGVSASGLVMAAGSFAQKFGWAIGGAMTGILLGLAGYVPGQAQSEQVREIMRFMMSFAPAICCLMGFLLMLVYPLSDKKVRELSERSPSGGA